MCLPEKPLVLSAPPSARVSKKEIVRSIQQMFRSSYLDSPIAMSLMWTLSIVCQAAQSLSTALDPSKEWISKDRRRQAPMQVPPLPFPLA
jgi:hypothetical protein